VPTAGDEQIAIVTELTMKARGPERQKGKIKVVVLGATGYTGEEIIRILVNHPHVEIAGLFSLEFVGQKVSEAFPRFSKRLDLVIQKYEPGVSLEGCEAVLACLPHKASMSFVAPILERGIKVIDLSADFRFANSETYAAAYGVKHGYPQLLERAVYGLPELYRERLKGCPLVAVPGCYPTSAILGAAPLLKKRLVRPYGIVIDAKSGVTGAGRTPSARFHFPECNESVSAYGIGKHRHQPEMEDQFSRLYGAEVKVTFAPHLVPMNRGLLSTIYLDPEGDVGLAEIRAAYEEMYQNEPFVTVLPDGVYPRTSDVAGTNSCHIGMTKTPEGKVVVTSAIDNLGKGASGQAIQCLNAVFGFDETEGLTRT
jgi:N-acetyl-gamma-glutamyl-phosphate reductase